MLPLAKLWVTGARAICTATLLLAGLATGAAAADGPAGVPLFVEWESFSRTSGLPADKVLALAATPEELWIGTDNGLARYRDGRFESWGVADGLAYPVVSGLAWDPETGDLWVATFGGLSRFSGGRFESFTQKDSGLANDVVYGVAVTGGRYVWAPTAAGTSRLDAWTGSWEIFNNRNAPMHEIWCYGVAAGEDAVFLAVWGGGVLRYDLARERWREFRDPDGEMELDLLRDDGPVSDVVAAVAYGEGVLWVATYFGVNRYDGRWRGYSVDDSGLASDFVNFVAAEGPSAWFATDDGLSHFDGTTWTTYRRNRDPDDGRGTITIYRDGTVEVLATRTALADNFASAVTRRHEEIWVGTETGLSRGRPQHPTTKGAGR